MCSFCNAYRDGFRVYNGVMNKAEQRFEDRAEEKGWTVLRSGWPDYLMFRKGKNGRLEFRAVEVKLNHKDDAPRANQMEMMAALEMLGVDCYVWGSKEGKLRRIIRWIDPRVIVERLMDGWQAKRQATAGKAATDEAERLGVLVRYHKDVG